MPRPYNVRAISAVRMRPWVMGRKAWLFAGSQLAGKRAAMVMSLAQSAKLTGYEPWAYLRDLLERPIFRNA
jgi:transposase